MNRVFRILTKSLLGWWAWRSGERFSRTFDKASKGCVTINGSETRLQSLPQPQGGSALKAFLAQPSSYLFLTLVLISGITANCFIQSRYKAEKQARNEDAN